MPEMPRAKILLLMPHLGGGGAERVIELLARGLDPTRYEVHLGLLTAVLADGKTLQPTVTLHSLGAKRVR